ncbi:MAG: HisA/HisF-related TIM barrel protein [Bacteroidota bacterium]
MGAIRIIPRLDIKGPNLVKGIHLEGLRVFGTPEDFAAYYYENGADELMYTDVVASLYERNSLNDLISNTAKKIFIPLTAGGGIRTIDDVKKVLRAGADKVSINTAAIKNPEFIREASRKFGSSTIVVTIEAIRQPNGEYFAYIDNGREHTGVEVMAWARRVEELGAGEIVLTSVDKEGTGEGFDIDLIAGVAKNAGIPVIAHGGAGAPEDIVKAINAGADAVSVSSILHYGFIHHNAYAVRKENEGNTEFLKKGKGYGKITPCDLSDLRNVLLENNIETRCKTA